jgi:hypothetical protein
MLKNIINILSYYSFYMMIVLSKPNFYLVWELTLLVFLLLIHFFLVIPNQKKIKSKEMISMFLLAFVGFLIDILLEKLGVFQFSKTFRVELYFLWICFAMTFNYSLRKLIFTPYLSFLLFGIGGPFSYFLASKINLFIYTEDFKLILLHSLLWILYLMIIKKILRFL